MDIKKVTPDKEQAKSILRVVNLIEERIKKEDKEKMASLIIADYYEIIKELITAILLVDGYKTLSHKDLVEYAKKLKELNEYEINIIDSLRILRNKVSYQGFLIEPDYLKRNESNFNSIMEKLYRILLEKLKIESRGEHKGEQKNNKTI